MTNKTSSTFEALYDQINSMLSKGRVILAIDGKSASGKTTLSKQLQTVYDCNVFHMDDFFLRPTQRTPARLAEPGGNVDRERFLEEVLLPLSRKLPVDYRPFDCSTFTLHPAVTFLPTQLTVIEGAYSMHPTLSGYYDFSVFLDIPAPLQKKRIEKRNSPDKASRFFSTWIPMENLYFKELQVMQRCDMIINITE